MKPFVAKANQPIRSKPGGRDVIVVALDLGTVTGWAVRDGDGNFRHGHVSFRPNRFEGGGMRYLRFSRWLYDLIPVAAEGASVEVYFEGVRRHAGVDAAHAYGGFLATLTAWCEHHQVPYLGIPVGTIKKHATGRGNAPKGDVIEALQLAGFPVSDSNEADALALLRLVVEKISPGSGRPKTSPQNVSRLTQ